MLNFIFNLHNQMIYDVTWAITHTVLQCVASILVLYLMYSVHTQSLIMQQSSSTPAVAPSVTTPPDAVVPPSINFCCVPCTMPF